MKILISLALFAAAAAAFEPQAIRLPNAPVPAYETVPDIKPLYIPSAVLEELAQKSPVDIAQPEPVMLAEAPLPEVEEPVQPFEVSKVQVADLSFATEEVSKVKIADLSFLTEESNKVNIVDMPLVNEAYQFDVVNAFPAELFTPVKVVDFVNEAPAIPVESVKVASISASPVQVASIDSTQFMYADPRLR